MEVDFMSRKERIENAQNRALERLDYVTDYSVASDFVEVTGKIGGDTVTFRVYDNGDMYER
jgi:hypothetical protein